MRTVWKWVIGIAVVLVVAAVIVGGAFVLRNRLGMMQQVVQVAPRYNQGPDGRMPFGGRGQNGGPGWMMPNRRGPMMGGRGFGRMGGMMPFMGLLGFLVFAGLITLLVLGILWMVRSQRRPMAAAAGPVPPVEPPASVVGTHSCKKCGEPVQDNMVYCPNCGKRQ